ncbi:hypothetical protein DAEQUDRAFT_730523 [Daedalea quercina L-15889]|uniref:Uncharacterized protein n=1 Tax=Daedalea quercina L-15889 TaxID=1314783 RepID=A0A165MVI0_9APHY|nr:hypothetical protein DAEQUDRAFT_730523 [Daedalea quercina L-15889]
MTSVWTPVEGTIPKYDVTPRFCSATAPYTSFVVPATPVEPGPRVRETRPSTNRVSATLGYMKLQPAL